MMYWQRVLRRYQFRLVPSWDKGCINDIVYLGGQEAWDRLRWKKMQVESKVFV